MPIPAELTELVAKLSPEDQTLLDQILTRNPDTASQLIAESSLYKAFVTGDDSKLPALAGTTLAAAAASADLTALADTIERRVASRYDSKVADLETRLSGIDVDKRAKEIAEQLFAEKSTAFAADVLGRAAKSSDEVYTIRRSHEREFGAELDTTKFTEYLNGNAGKFASLSAAHDAYVQEDRINKRIDQGVAERVAAASTTGVPGQQLPQEGPLGMFIADNAKRTAASTGAVSRGEGLDAAVKAFREIQVSRMH